MIGNRKLIALCTSRVFDPQVHSFIELLNEELKTNGCTLFIFAINADLYWEEDADESETSVFGIIDWKRTDAVVIMDEKIKSRRVSSRIIDDARKNSVPVVVVDGVYEDTINISFDYPKGFEAIVRHVIEDHKVKDPHIMAGFRDNKFSNERIDVFKKVIEENGMAFDEDRVSYGEFWSQPSRVAARELLKRDKLPDAVICANDIMAINVCDIFRNAGIKIPEDVIVTGFDGYDEAFLSNPAITTAGCMTPELAGATAKAVFDVLKGERADDYTVIPRMIKNESCGCPRCNDNIGNTMKKFNTGFYRYQDDIRRQHSVSAKMQTCTGVDELISIVRDYYMPHVSIIVKKDCFKSDRNFFVESDDSQDYCYFYNSQMPDAKRGDFDPDILQPSFDDMLKSGYPLIFNSLDYMNKALGFICYSFPTYDLTEYSKTAGISNMISEGLGGYINLRYQQFLFKKIEEIYSIDPLTGLINRFAFHGSIESIKASAGAEGTDITVIMADLDGLKTINDTLGHDAGDRAIAEVAYALKSSCPDDAICVRFGGDEMLAVVPGITDASGILEDIEEKLNKKTEEFGFKIAASCGAYHSVLREDTDLDRVIKQADEKMYMIKNERKKKG